MPSATTNGDSLHTSDVQMADHRFDVKRVVTDSASLKAERVTVKINDLVINGFASQGGRVANFRGIQYATIPARWRQAVPLDPAREKGIIDATQWGARHPQPVDGLHDATRHLYPRMSTFDRQSEFDCLNLNVYGPKNVVGKRGRGLPVLVWIHGGAFVYGDGGCEFDGQYLVRRSLELGQPILLVGLNYRLGYLGFLTSNELREEARSHGEEGYANLGLHDQRLALQWIQQNIHFFGGDGHRLTVAGESAGANAIMAHLRGRVALFQNAFIMSPVMSLPASQSDAQKSFDRLVSEAGLSDAPASQKLAALRSILPLVLQSLDPERQDMFYDDPAFFCDYSGENWEEIRTLPSWASRVVVGHTKQETALFSQLWASMSPEQLYAEWEELYEDEAYGREVLAAYDIHKDSSHADLVAGYIAYTNDALFAKTAYSAATSHLQDQSRPGPRTYRYSFDQVDILSPNPIFYGGAYHSLDNAFLFYFPQVAGPDAPDAFRESADKYSGAVLRLVNGDEPWEDVSAAKRFFSINGRASGMKGEEESSHHRWEKLGDTPERRESFLLASKLLLKAMGYSMSMSMGMHCM